MYLYTDIFSQVSNLLILSFAISVRLTNMTEGTSLMQDATAVSGQQHHDNKHHFHDLIFIVIMALLLPSQHGGVIKE